MCVRAECEIPMHLIPRGGLRHPHRSAHPHEAVCKVAAPPPCKEVLQMEDSKRIHVAVLMWGRSSTTGGRVRLAP